MVLPIHSCGSGVYITLKVITLCLNQLGQWPSIPRPKTEYINSQGQCCGSVLASMRIRIRIEANANADSDTDPDPGSQINADPGGSGSW
jgi:hypothetical protein